MGGEWSTRKERMKEERGGRERKTDKFGRKS